jgi:hypothetical protein
MWLVLCVVTKQIATAHSHVCLTLGVVVKQTVTTLFYKMPNVRRSNEPNTYFNLGSLGAPHLWQHVNLRRGALGSKPNMPLVFINFLEGLPIKKNFFEGLNSAVY